MNNINRKKTSDRYSEAIVQPLFAGFSILVIFLAFGVIFFINPAYEVKKVAYACGEPTETPTPMPTPTPTPTPETQHLGTPQNGSMVNDIRLVPNEDYMVFVGSTDKNWTGTRLNEKMQDVATFWGEYHPNDPRIQIWRISYHEGGDMPNANSHENGLDFDIRYIRTDGNETRLDITTDSSLYDQSTTQDLVDFLELLDNLEYIFTRPSAGLTGSHINLTDPEHHKDHIHVRFTNPSTW